MSDSGREVSVKAHMEIGQVIEYLEALIASLKEGKVYVEQGTNVIALMPADSMEVEIEAVEKKGKQKFNMELAWHKKALSVQDVGLRISSTKPRIVETEDDDIDADESEEETEEQ